MVDHERVVAAAVMAVIVTADAKHEVELSILSHFCNWTLIVSRD
jgi:hypothetical protein